MLSFQGLSLNKTETFSDYVIKYNVKVRFKQVTSSFNT